MSATQTPVATIFVVADEDGRALAVVPTMADAQQAARDDALAAAQVAYEDDGNGFSFEWITRVNERCPQWTQLTARLVGDPSDGPEFAGYVITELVAGADTGGTFVQSAPRPQAKVVRTELAIRDDAGDFQPVETEAPQAPEPTTEAETTDGPSQAAAAPTAVKEPTEKVEPAKVPGAEAPAVKCEGGYEGCSGTVETTDQVFISQTRQRAALCSNCFKHEVKEQIPARVA